MGVLDKLKPSGGGGTTSGKSQAKSKSRNQRFKAGIIGLVTILVAGAAVAFALQANKGVPFENRQYIRAAFSDAGDTHVDADVREAAIRVGRLDQIDLENGQGILTLQIDDTQPIYKNATAQIVSRSGLGQKFINMTRGDPSAGRMNNYDTIPITQTAPSVEILDLADLFTPQTTKAAQSSLQQLGAGLQGHTQDLRDAFDGISFNLPPLQRVASALNNNNGADVNRTLSSLDSLSSRFEGREQQLTDLNRQLATTLDAVDVNRGKALQSLLEVAPPSFRDVRAALQNLQSPLETTNSALVNLRPAVNGLVAATPDTRGVLREAPAPLSKVPGVSQVGTPAVASLTPVFRNLQPLAPKITTAVNSAVVPVNYLSPNASDIAYWFTRATNVLSQGDANGNWARFDAIPSCGVVTGVALPVPGNDCSNSDATSNGAAGSQTANSGNNNSTGTAASTLVPSTSSLLGGGR